MKYLQKKTCVTLFIILLLQGCASNKSFVDTKSVDKWALTGKIGIAYPSHNCQNDYCPPHSEQGKLKWQQNKSVYNFEISDPFGRVVIEISGDEQLLRAKIPGKQTINTTPSEFIALIAGKSKQKSVLKTLSQEDLRHWVTGRPAPEVPHEKKGDNEFEQKGFNIRSIHWRRTPTGNMPALVVIKKDKFQLRIVISEWLTAMKQ